MTKKHILRIGTLFLVLLIFCLSGCKSEKAVGVLDLQEIIEKAPAAQQFQDKLDEAGEEIEQRFAHDSLEISEEERMALQQKAYQEYLAVKQQLEEELNAEIERAVEEVVKEKKVSVVIYKQAVRYGGLDITEFVIEKLQ